MSNILKFLKSNKIAKANVFYQATKSLCDENGMPLEWEIKHISTKENECLRERYTKEIPIKGRHGQFRPSFDYGAYTAGIIAASVVSPDLYDAKLQDSYGVSTPEALVQEMVDDSGEWVRFIDFVNNLNGFKSIDEDVDEAKN